MPSSVFHLRLCSFYLVLVTTFSVTVYMPLGEWPTGDLTGSLPQGAGLLSGVSLFQGTHGGSGVRHFTFSG